ncbi:hypothetical protein [Cellulomonas sp. HD19AZ1]|uniref:hypothetical protein n=1 Tax=Cellulomonas sp. HD19AZ1 TaxID=2559593 RepID=UPI00107117F3|nr:hypothetical protein [Cellulomonas sp. HD19AZ1]TFH68151.1 hypothetical protein E4A51_18070 [Cellulomonas sp. HD19AZ1]
MDLTTWVAPVITGLVALAGIGATLATAAKGRAQAAQLAADRHQTERAEDRRRERITLFVDALAHVRHLERKLNRFWVGDSYNGYDASPKPAGPPMSLTPLDEVGIRIELIAPDAVQRAWVKFVEATESLGWWFETDWNGEADAKVPASVAKPLYASMRELRTACRHALQGDSAPD